MDEYKIRIYNDLDGEKEVLDSFRKMKFMYGYAGFKLHWIKRKI